MDKPRNRSQRLEYLYEHDRVRDPEFYRGWAYSFSLGAGLERLFVLAGREYDSDLAEHLESLLEISEFFDVAHGIFDPWATTAEGVEHQYRLSYQRAYGGAPVMTFAGFAQDPETAEWHLAIHPGDYSQLQVLEDYLEDLAAADLRKITQVVWSLREFLPHAAREILEFAERHEAQPEESTITLGDGQIINISGHTLVERSA